MKLLLVEDELGPAQALARILRDAGFLVDLAHDGGEGLRLAESGLYSLILLDHELPVRTGLDICVQLREAQIHTPIMMLTAHAAAADKVQGLNAGADDYLTKPFDLPELLARVQSLLRRAHRNSSSLLKLADLEMDMLTRSVKRGGTEVSLSPREFSLLRYLFLNAGRALSREQILRQAWPTDYSGGSNVVDVYIRYLRRKLDESFWPRLIQTVPGMGYSLRNS